ncbi:MAG: DUF503 domain-containing protein [Thermaerobacter sp.]|nr:DUF503 domain-containing protein [Thermaerobacter sp.]
MRIPWARSLKDKRQVAQSLIAKIGRQLPIAIAEVDHLDDPQLLGLGICAVANSRMHAERMVQEALAEIGRAGLDARAVEIGER